MAKPGRPRKRRNRTQHVGVKILRRERDGRVFWIGRWYERDDDTGQRRPREVSLTALARPEADLAPGEPNLNTHEGRVAWAKDQAALLAKRKGEVATNRRDVADAVADYFAAQTDLRPKTRTLYEQALNRLTTWAKGADVWRCDHLTPDRLAALHDYIRGLRAREVQAGDKMGRGARKPGRRPLAPATRNQVLRAIRTFLGYIRRRGLTPALSSDSIADRLPYFAQAKAETRFLRASEVAALVSAAQRHDQTPINFVRRGVPRGNVVPVPRIAIRPFLLACLLTGARFAEVAGLRWEEVDLGAGEIRLPATRTKTKSARTIGLDVCPSLWAMFNAMRLQAGDTEAAPFVFGGKSELSRDLAETARARLRKFGAPKAWTWHDLRRTCGTFLTCAPSIYGAASVFLSAKRLGHSVQIAEKLYLGSVKIDPRACTLEQAMGLEPLPAPAPSRDVDNAKGPSTA